MTKFLLATVLAAILIAPLALAADPPAAGGDQFNPAWGAILPAAQAASLSPNGPATITGTWLPTDDDIKMLEPLLAVQLKAELARDGRGRSLRVADFYRQYGGIVEGGQRLIIVNGFHKSYVERRGKMRDFWKHEPVFVMDGGCNYFHAALDVATKEFAYLSCQSVG